MRSVLVAASAALTVSACTSTSSPAPGTTTPDRPNHVTSTAPTPHSTPPRRVPPADIDGDGQADAIRVRWQHRSSLGGGFRGTVLVSVAFAKGGTARMPVRIASWNGANVPDVATGQVDGLPGSEIVLPVDNSPASFVSYRVVSDHAGHLVELPAPGPRIGSVPGAWWVGATVGTGGTGFDCGLGHVMFVRTEPERSATAPVHEVRKSYVWRHGRWQFTGGSTLITPAGVADPHICQPWRGSD